jgi:hypothetical protein
LSNGRSKRIDPVVFMCCIVRLSVRVQEMKERVLKEFKKRETNTNPQQKMKWDATVKMRQSKLRAEGQTVSRSDTVRGPTWQAPSFRCCQLPHSVGTSPDPICR